MVNIFVAIFFMIFPARENLEYKQPEKKVDLQ